MKENLMPEDINTSNTAGDLLNFVIGPEGHGKRIDAFLGEAAADFSISREKVKKAIQSGNAMLNGKVERTPSHKLLQGDKLSFALPVLQSAAQPEDAELEVIYQDADLIIINKGPGLTVHPCPSCPEGTLVNRLLSRFPELGAQGGERPGIVHRLDKDTSGLIIVAHTEEQRLALAEDFAERNIKKEYLAVVYGVPVRKTGTINAPIGRHSTHKTKMAVQPKGGREALSEYRTLYADPLGRFSLLAVRIHTGRTHQIRVHMSHIGHPLVGDSTYFDSRKVKAALGLEGGEGVKASSVKGKAELTGEALHEFLKRFAKRQLLHASKLEFTHPGTGEAVHFCCAPPDDFFAAIAALSERTQRVVLTGNPACGKSSVLQLFIEQGIPVWSADKAVAALYEAGADGWHILKGRYAERFVNAAGVDKKALFEAMYADDHLRREVEALIHPLVFAKLAAFWAECGAYPAPAPLAVAEVPLWFEAGTGRGVSEMQSGVVSVGIHCPFSVRAKRMQQNRHWPDSMIEKMESWQWDEAKKMQAANLVLDNSGSSAELKPKVDELMKTLQDLEEKRVNEILGYCKSLTGCDG